MGRYTHLFHSTAEYEQERSNNYVEPWVSYTENVGTNYNMSEEQKRLITPLTLKLHRMVPLNTPLMIEVASHTLAFYQQLNTVKMGVNE